ncbi:hypothetical protein NE237_027886 [Protea cynaroides]|uniref:Uncharacterized protein n=1 Tax=Protea cynaroides TaxID=273540 RepID=A0A9Q0GSR1_9MAGN|nr:hypothetical protein NE237_027886 [Protea cynaroides]
MTSQQQLSFPPATSSSSTSLCHPLILFLFFSINFRSRSGLLSGLLRLIPFLTLLIVVPISRPRVAALYLMVLVVFPKGRDGGGGSSSGGSSNQAAVDALAAEMIGLNFEETGEDENYEYGMGNLTEHACTYCGVHNPACVVRCHEPSCQQ